MILNRLESYLWENLQRQFEAELRSQLEWHTHCSLQEESDASCWSQVGRQVWEQMIDLSNDRPLGVRL